MAQSHVSRFRDVLDRIEVTAVVDINKKRAQSVANLLPNQPARISRCTVRISLQAVAAAGAARAARGAGGGAHGAANPARAHLLPRARGAAQADVRRGGHRRRARDRR